MPQVDRLEVVVHARGSSINLCIRATRRAKSLKSPSPNEVEVSQSHSPTFKNATERSGNAESSQPSMILPFCGCQPEWTKFIGRRGDISSSLQVTNFHLRLRQLLPL